MQSVDPLGYCRGRFPFKQRRGISRICIPNQSNAYQRESFRSICTRLIELFSYYRFIICYRFMYLLYASLQSLAIVKKEMKAAYRENLFRELL